MKQIALFDFDGTITDSDSFIGLIRAAVGTRGLIVAILRNLPYIAAWKLGFYSNSKAKEKLFATVFAGKTVEAFNEIIDKYFSSAYPKIIRPKAKEYIERLHDEGVDIYVVTASGECWVTPFANALGIDKVIGTGIAIDDGIVTVRFSTPNCHGQEKVNRIKDIFTPRSEYHILAFGDSSGDMPMLEFADEKFYKHFE